MINERKLIEELKKLTSEDLEAIEGIGPESAKDVYERVHAVNLDQVNELSDLDVSLGIGSERIKLIREELITRVYGSG